jgi:quercetin dioxygenase-like cupin family protein
MPENYQFIQDLAADIAIPESGTHSRTVYQDEAVKVVAFGFAQGEELSEHTASMPAQLYFVRGKMTVTLGGDSFTAQPGTWAHMAAHLKHSLKAEEPAAALLVLIKAAKEK